MTARGWLRAGLVFLAIAQGVAGVVQLLLPKVFYQDFPIPAHPWVSRLPPTHLAGMPAGDAIVQTALIAMSVVLPGVLLVVSGTTQSGAARVPASPDRQAL